MEGLERCEYSVRRAHLCWAAAFPVQTNIFVADNAGGVGPIYENDVRWTRGTRFSGSTGPAVSEGSVLEFIDELVPLSGFPSSSLVVH